MGLYENALQATPGQLKNNLKDRQHLTRLEVENFLRAECEAYPERQARAPRPDTSSVEAYRRSVAPQRAAWEQTLGVWEFPAVVQDAVAAEPFFEDEQTLARWIHVPLAGELRAHALFATPKAFGGKRPLLLCQHGIGSGPERTFGFADEEGIYHSYARRAVEAGFCVLAPLHVTETKPRARMARLCSLLGRTLWGLEMGKLRRLLDWAAARPEVDAARMGMWGISLGGAYTLMFTPIEERLKAGICTAWFNHRVKKMALDDPRYSCFLSVDEEHVWIRGWLEAYSDAELAALICPRALQVQCGKADGIAWWPFVQEEFARARAPYDALGLGERIELDLHEGGHEIRVEAGLRFMKRWLEDEPVAVAKRGKRR